jgi:hypothetical protein
MGLMEWWRGRGRLLGYEVEVGTGMGKSNTLGYSEFFLGGFGSGPGYTIRAEPRNWESGYVDCSYDS